MNIPEIPQVLKKKLIFGDCDQIEAIKNYETEHENYYGKDGEKRFRVCVEVEYSETIIVCAKNEEEAIKAAKEELDLRGIGFGVHCSVREIK